MGGQGSGRWGGDPTIEGCASIVLDINALVRAGLIVARCRSKGTLSIGDVLECHFEANTGDPWASWLKLNGEAWTYSNGRFPLSQHIDLTQVATNFGGRRWLFLCPRRSEPVVKLYLPNGAREFASRLAYRLAYQSQRETRFDRRARRARKLHRRLGGDGEALGQAPPPRPKGMRCRTYERLLAQWEIADARAEEAFAARIRWPRWWPQP